MSPLLVSVQVQFFVPSEQGLIEPSLWHLLPGFGPGFANTVWLAISDTEINKAAINLDIIFPF